MLTKTETAGTHPPKERVESPLRRDYCEAASIVDPPSTSALRRLVGRIFGFAREIALLQEQVSELSWDTAYGMWTRGAFLQFCQVMPRSTRIVVFIDLDDIHTLNKNVGYSEVDRRIRNTFSVPFRRSDVVARWYSGDEIVILFDSDREGANRKLEELVRSAAAEGMSLKNEIGEWEVGKQAAQDVIDVLADKVSGAKMAGCKTVSRD